MKARIYSWFKSGNIGDILIAKTSKELFSNYFTCDYYDIVSGAKVDEPQIIFSSIQPNSLKSKILDNKYLRSIIDFIFSFKENKIANFENANLNECDIAVFFGGNSLMDLGEILPSESIILNRRISKLKENNINVAFLFSGVGPFKNNLSKRVMKKTLKMIDFISVRDVASFELCKSLGRTDDIEIWRDPVLSYKPSFEIKSKDIISLNVYFGSDKSKIGQMKQSYVFLIRAIKEKFNDKKIALYCSEMNDYKNLSNLKEYFKNDKMVIFVDVKNENDIFELYSKSIVVIGCRMHSLITAIISKVPVVAISWQQKVTSLMQFFNFKEYMVTQEQFCESPDSVVFMICNAVKNEEKIVNGYESALQKLDEQTKKSIKQFCERLGE